MHQPTVVVTQPQPVQVITTNPQPAANVVIQTSPPETISYAQQTSLILGALQITCGCVAILINIILRAINSDVPYYIHSDSGYGFWCGVFFLISGALGVGASKNPRNGMIVGHMVMSIFSVIFAGILFISSAIGAADPCTYDWYIYNPCSMDANRSLNIVLSLVAVLEFVLGIWASVICCSASCCRQSTSHGGIVAPVGTVQHISTAVTTPAYTHQQQLQQQQQQLPAAGQPYPPIYNSANTVGGPSNPPPPNYDAAPYSTYGKA